MPESPPVTIARSPRACRCRGSRGEEARRQVEVGLAARLGLVLRRQRAGWRRAAACTAASSSPSRRRRCLLARVARVLRCWMRRVALAGRGGAERAAREACRRHRSFLIGGRAGGRARAAPITVAITVIMCAMSTGLSTCAWKPAANAASRPRSGRGR
jgi:hypothetical protein